MTESRQDAMIAPIKNAILIAGPTASGKSALALALAQKCNGVVVNADSMQVYAVLDVLTARPPKNDLAKAPHRLYGHIDPAQPYSTGAWLDDVASLVTSGALETGRPIFVGGTGLYFKALLEGLSPMPPVDPAIRAAWRQALASEGAEQLHAQLAARDGAMAATLAPSDGQRIVRALEVLEASGRSLLFWQQQKGVPLVDAASAEKIVIEPERETLRGWIGRRFDAMVGQGALDEARLLAALGLDPAMPAMKAIGVRELLAYDNGALTLPEASERATILTRQYAKRQMTWFRNQCDESWNRVAVECQEDLINLANIFECNS